MNTSDGKGRGKLVEYARDGSILRAERFAREFDSFGNPTKVSIFLAQGGSDYFELTEIIYWTVTYYEQK